MTQCAAIWRAGIRSQINAWRHDGRVRLSWIGILLATIIGGISAGSALWSQLGQWRSTSHSTQLILEKLGLVAGGIWSAIFVSSIVYTFEIAFARDEARLLVTMPIPPASRYRALVGLVTGKLAWLFIFVFAIILPMLVISLGGVGLACSGWIIAGAVASLLIGTLTSMAIVRLAISRAAIPAAMALIGATSFVIFRITDAQKILLRHWNHAPVAMACLVGVITLLKPLSPALGKFYVSSLLFLLERKAAKRVIRETKSFFARLLLSRLRGPIGAFFWRGYVCRGRNPITAIRFAILALAILCFPSIWNRTNQISASLVLPCFVLVSIQLAFNEITVQGLAGEGDRLTLLFLAADRTRLILARFITALVPLAISGALITFCLGRWVHVSHAIVLWATAEVVLITVGSTAIMVFTGTADADIYRSVDGPMEAFLAEDAPLTPLRMLALFLAAGFQLMASLVVWKLPPISGMGLVALADVALVMMLFRFSRRRLEDLIKKS